MLNRKLAPLDLNFLVKQKLLISTFIKHSQFIKETFNGYLNQFITNVDDFNSLIVNTIKLFVIKYKHKQYNSHTDHNHIYEFDNDTFFIKTKPYIEYDVLEDLYGRILSYNLELTWDDVSCDFSKDNIYNPRYDFYDLLDIAKYSDIEEIKYLFYKVAKGYYSDNYTKLSISSHFLDSYLSSKYKDRLHDDLPFDTFIECIILLALSLLGMKSPYDIVKYYARNSSDPHYKYELVFILEDEVEFCSYNSHEISFINSLTKLSNILGSNIKSTDI